MSSVSSNQSVVRDRADFEEVYPSGHKDQESPGEERSSSSSSSSSTNKDMEMAEQEEVSDDSKEQALKSIVGADGLREFIMLPEWTVNNFKSTIKEKHFNTSTLLGIISKFQITSPFVCPISQRNAIMKG